MCKTKGHATKECRANTGKTVFAKRAEDQEEHEDNKNEHAFTFTVSDNNVERLGKSFRSNPSVNTGATSHIITDKSKFVAFDKNFNARGHVIELADGSKANVVRGKGTAKIRLYDINGITRKVILRDTVCALL